jgi:ABC-type bacteriocin/lantibiotic exporter with double-glycine peptidase domain
LKYLLSIYNLNINEQDLKRNTKVTDGGTTAENLIVAAKSYGFFGKVLDNQSMEKLEKEVKVGPVIVDWYAPFFNEGHYSVAVKTTKSFIYLADPLLGGIRKISKKNFEKRWFDYLGDVYPNNPKDLIKRRMIIIKPK